VAPIAPLTLLPAVMRENVAPAGRKKKKASKIKSTRNISVEEVRRSARIAAARSMTVVVPDPIIIINNGPVEPAKELTLLAPACATYMDVAEDDRQRL
jgi:hypothetical protein